MFDTSFRKNNVVKLVDSIMGSYKTTRMIEWMDSNPHKKYIYVSPLLSEVGSDGRVHKALKNVMLEIPSDEITSKSESFLNMLKQGDSIACTHSLYLNMSDIHFSELCKQGYTVIIDEEVNVIDGFDKYSQSDLRWLLEKEDITIRSEDGMVEWVGKRDKIDKKHKYYDFVQYCDSKSLYSAKRSDTIMVTQLPIKLFEVAREVIVLTYMFKGNVLDCFLKLKGFQVEDFTEITCTKKDKDSIKELLTVIPPSKKISGYGLSATWWAEANAKSINDVANFIKTNSLSLGLKGDDVLWTAPKARSVKTAGQKKNLVKPKGYIIDSTGVPCYLAVNTRATNEFRHKKAMFHCYNRRPLVPVSAYLQDYGHGVDFKVFATSEMVQWLWRGCIRDNSHMIVAIASERMYNYFMEWLESES